MLRGRGKCARVKAAAPSARRRNVSGSWPGGQQRPPCTWNVPGALERPPARLTPQRCARARRLQQLLGARAAAFGRPRRRRRTVMTSSAVAPEEGELGGSERGAERGDGLREPVLVRHQAVDVALDEGRRGSLAHRGRAPGRARRGGLPLRVERGLRRVEVLRLLVAEGAPAEGHHASLQIADGKEQPAAEAIVEAGAPGLTRADEPGCGQRLVADALAPSSRRAGTPSPPAPSRGRSAGRARGRCRGRSRYARARSPPAAPQRCGVEAARPAPSRGAGPPRPERCSPRRSSGMATPARWASARTASGKARRSWRIRKREGVAAHAAAEAVEDALLGIDGEGRRLLGVEGAEALPVAAPARCRFTTRPTSSTMSTRARISSRTSAAKRRHQSSLRGRHGGARRRPRGAGRRGMTRRRADGRRGVRARPCAARRCPCRGRPASSARPGHEGVVEVFLDAGRAPRRWCGRSGEAPAAPGAASVRHAVTAAAARVARRGRRGRVDAGAAPGRARAAVTRPPRPWPSSPSIASSVPRSPRCGDPTRSPGAGLRSPAAGSSAVGPAQSHGWPRPRVADSARATRRSARRA